MNKISTWSQVAKWKGNLGGEKYSRKLKNDRMQEKIRHLGWVLANVLQC